MKSVRDLLKELQDHKISLEDAEHLLKSQYIEHIDGCVQLDLFRQHRTGIPEVIFAETKTPEITLEITKKMLEKNHFALVSRLKKEHIDILKSHFQNVAEIELEINQGARIAYLKKKDLQLPQKPGLVGIITAGTSDIQIAEESKLVLKGMGINTITTYDVGIAGIHRLFPPLENMIKSDVDVLIVIAGMEGTLPGVIAALVDVPVIGVPASTGYGLGANGIGALTTMLQSCSPGLAIVNIDNGFGAAAMAALILKQIYEKRDKKK